MAEKILMPKLSDTMEEGVIASWQVKVGDKVSTGDVLAEIETDKATMEHEAYEEGTILYLVEEGSTVTVDELIAIIGKEGEDISGLLSTGGEAKKESPAPDKKEEKEEASKGSNANGAETATATKKETKVSNAVIVQMPKLSDTMEEGVIADWHKKVGDTVSMGDVLVEIETDKATMEHEAYDEGVLLYIAAEKGDAIPVNDLLCVIGEKGADYEALIRQFKSGQSDESEEEEESTPSPEAKEESSSTTDAKSNGKSQTTENGRIKISPLARKLAEDKGFDIDQISGSGEGGRIVKKDIESFQPSKSEPAKEKTESKASATAPAPSSGVQGIGQESFEEKKTSQMRKTIARRLSESKFTAPHFYLTIEIDMEEAMETRKKLNEISPVKISFNDMIVKAAAVALRQHPAVNASWQGETVRYNHHVNVGIAVAVEEGLLVPVIRFADAKSLSQISSETKELAQKAKDKKLQPSEWEGSTFSVSNLGMFGIEEFTAIINPPDACIMAIGAIVSKPIVKNGEVVPGNLMKVTLSCDHRVVDGATGAQFLATFKSLMESPIRMLV